MTEVPACLEIGSKRVFAAALDWPGWCRSGKGEQEALDALIAAAPRYKPVVALAGLVLPEAGVGDLVVLERLPGTATTDFGAPCAIAEADHRALSAEEASRLAAIVGAAWAYLDSVAAGAPAALRKGPRGGGRDRDKVMEHELDAAVAYARKLGLRDAAPAPHDAAAVAGFRQAVLEALSRPSSGQAPAERGWPPRYMARRLAWHTLDHAWEIQDRS